MAIYIFWHFQRLQLFKAKLNWIENEMKLVLHKRFGLEENNSPTYFFAPTYVQARASHMHTHAHNFLLWGPLVYSSIMSMLALTTNPILFTTRNSFDLSMNSPIFSRTTIALFVMGPTSLIHTFYSELQGSYPEVGSEAQSLVWFLRSLLAAGSKDTPPRPSPAQGPRAAGPTWKAQDGEVGPALGEPWALPHAAPPEPLVLEHGGDGVVVQVLGAPHVHPRGGDAPRQAQEGQEEAHHLARGGGHGLGPARPPPAARGLAAPSSCAGCAWASCAPERSCPNQMVSLGSWCLLTLFSLDSSVSLLVQGHYVFIC